MHATQVQSWQKQLKPVLRRFFSLFQASLKKVIYSGIGPPQKRMEGVQRRLSTTPRSICQSPSVLH